LESADVQKLKVGRVNLGEVGYAIACIAAAAILIVSGYAHQVVKLTDALGFGVALGSVPTDNAGAMNILVMGLESRTTFQGQDLSVQQLTETHSGNEASVEAGLEGSQDTDTLILVHIAAGGGKATGFSIPRDDVVNYPHDVTVGSTVITEGKIDAAYAYAYDQSLDQTVNSSLTSAQRYLQANQAGQLFEVQTVESVTGVHIDHFIESNIIGFYELSQQFGGLEVCIRPAPAQGGLPAKANLTDHDVLTGTDNSGFNAYADGYNGKKGGKQYLHLSAAQSLAYVRSRDTLPGIDIGRTARQQAAIEYILWKLKTSNVLTDLSTVTTLLANAKSYLMYDSDWDLIGSAQDLLSLSSSHLDFDTLPEVSTNNVSIPGYPSAQSANYIDVPAIQQQVNKAFNGTPLLSPTASSVTVAVYNGGGASGLAGDVSQDLVAMGYKAGTIADSSTQSQPLQDGTQVFYGAGSATQTNAQLIANVMGVQSATSLPSLPAGHVEVLLGSQVLAQAPGLEMLGADTVNASDYVTAAGENNQSVPSNIQAAATAGSTTEVPAYSQPLPSPKPSSAPKKASPKSTKKAASNSGSSATNSDPQYGLTTCPY
jgi:anionic cell wall polymer biosynthesis LytR-Cps2A-Psr (LCP) family protein